MLTFGFSGVRSLESILAGHPSLACTSGTGVLPLCAQAAATWKQVEQSPAAMSALAASSVRALAGSMITSILAATGGNRWCEIVMAPAGAAETFARLFPQARFVCFYRACPPMISAATQVSRWGLASTGLGDFASKYPGNNVAAVVAYWCASTTALLDFEAAQPGRSLRVRQEDLAASPAATTSSILAFLSLTGYHADLPEPPAQSQDAPGSAGPSGAAAEPQIPLELLPATMLDRINGLHARLGYPALAREPQPTELADHAAGRTG